MLDLLCFVDVIGHVGVVHMQFGLFRSLLIQHWYFTTNAGENCVVGRSCLYRVRGLGVERLELRDAPAFSVALLGQRSYT